MSSATLENNLQLSVTGTARMVCPSPTRVYRLNHVFCSNPKCRSLFVTKNSRRMCCSKKCSAWFRNWKYYDSLRGRFNKRAAASRYFQAHRQELYEKKRTRFERYEQEIIANDHFDELPGLGRLGSSQQGLPLADYTLLAAKNLARALHDHHPRATGDTPRGRLLWEDRHPEHSFQNFVSQTSG